MKLMNVSLIALLLSGAGIGDALADHGRFGYRGSVGVVIGPYWGPWYYPPPQYYYPPVVIERAPPPVYIEQQPAMEIVPAPVAPTNYWYFCRESNGYYPYVKECPGGWHKVLPQPKN